MMFDFPARFARLAHFQQRAAQPETVADMDRVLGQTLRNNVLAKCRGARKHVVPAQPRIPFGIVVARVMVHRHVRPAMMFGIGHHVACEAETSDRDGSCQWTLVDRAHLGAVEGLGLSGTQRVDIDFHAGSLRRVKAAQSRWTPSAPLPR